MSADEGRARVERVPNRIDPFKAGWNSAIAAVLSEIPDVESAAIVRAMRQPPEAGCAEVGCRKGVIETLGPDGEVVFSEPCPACAPAVSRHADLIARLDECRKMIGNMCSEGRCPKMSIPCRPDVDEDVVICRTLKEAMVALGESSESNERGPRPARNPGYMLVPIEPTEAMVAAGFAIHPCATGETKVTDAYKAMVHAGPDVGTTGPAPVVPRPPGGPQPPESRADFYAYINATPPLMSLLYDLDLMPEQTVEDSEAEERMFKIADHWFAHDADSAEIIDGLRVENDDYAKAIASAPKREIPE